MHKYRLEELILIHELILIQVHSMLVCMLRLIEHMSLHLYYEDEDHQDHNLFNKYCSDCFLRKNDKILPVIFTVNR